ncbi:MAG: S-layer homology domain-containing protein [Bacilli bacterium]
MKRTLITVAAAVVVMGSLSSSVMASTFDSTIYNDVSVGSYGARQIMNLTADGYIHGYSDGSFRPNAPITRGQFLIYFMNEVQNATHLSPQAASKQYFSDVPANNWAYQYVGAAEQAGWLNPSWLSVKVGGRFHENFHASMADIAALFVAAMEKSQRLTLPPGASPLSYATQLGIFRGIIPVDKYYINRAGAAIVLNNILNWLQGALLPMGEIPVVSSSSRTVAPNSIVQLHVVLQSAKGGPTIRVPGNAAVSYAMNNAPGAFIESLTGTMIVTSPGTYTVTATIDGVQSAPYTITAYDQAAAVDLSAASSSLVANGQETDAITATVVGITGQPVTNFNGTVNLAPLQYGDYVDPATGSEITVATFTHGVATFAIKAGTTGSVADTIALSGLTSTNDQPVASAVNYGSTTVNYAWPTANTIALTPATASVSSNQATEDQVNASISDASGVTLTSGVGVPVLATFSLSGPGSFSANGAPVTTMSGYLIPGSSTVLPVWSIPGQTGAITVQAAAAGLASQTVTLSAVQTGPPESFTLTPSAGVVNAVGNAQEPTLPEGSPFTVYTVQLVDAQGNPVVPASNDALTISDNTATVGGSLAYYAVQNGQPSGTESAAAAISDTTGQAQFAVVNTQTGAANPTITVTDTLGISKTATFTYSVGTPAYALFPADTLANLTAAASNVEAGQTPTYAIQLQDVNGNNLSTSGQSVAFFFVGKNTANATIDGSSSWTARTPYTTTTTPDGQTVVTVSVPNGAQGGFTIGAAVTGQSNVAQESVAVESPFQYTTMLNLATYVNGVAAAPWPTAPMTVGQTLAQYVGGSSGSVTGNLFVTPENASQSYTNTNDLIEITSSDPSVLAITGNSNWAAISGSTFMFLGYSQSALPTITAEQPGVATLTMTDLSNPSQPKITETVTVTS